MIITVESLNTMFEGHNSASRCSYRGKCQNCGCDVEVEIIKTSCGYGLKGGILFGTDLENLLVQCCDCHVKFGEPT